MSAPLLKTDILVIGAGIAGLWLSNRLQQAGYSVLTLENKAIGCGQTIASQGIIHGGAKYALGGSLSETGKQVKDMPLLWQKCIAGQGEIDLTDVTLLSEHQYLWSQEGFASRLAAFLASKTLRSKIKALPKSAFPPPFNHPHFKGGVYQLQEIVVDIPSLLAKLASNCYPYILHSESLIFDLEKNNAIKDCTVKLNDGSMLKIIAQRYILAAGAGNEALLKPFGHPMAPMQRRPLQMAVVKHSHSIPLYAHCATVNPKPRITITTHPASDGKTVWYLGGALAENGANQPESVLIANARSELNDLFPWLDFSAAEIRGYSVDRAEPAQADGHLPGECYTKTVNNLLITWPTKLALAPTLANDVLAQLQNTPIIPQHRLLSETIMPYPHPPLATPIWN